MEDRESIPYTSGGFNQAPVWIYHNIDISQYVGQKVHIQFDFQTLDSLYNGFRGWFIDDVKVLDTPGEVIPEPDVKITKELRVASFFNTKDLSVIHCEVFFL